jgi:predicted Zn-dependent protease
MLLAASLTLACAVAPAHAQGFGDLLKKVAPVLPLPGAGAPAQTRQPTSALPNLAGTSLEEEVAIGRQLAGDLLGAAPLVKNDALQAYVNNVGRWIALQSERPDLPWHFGVLESSDINAFSLPGGYVFVTRGLYQGLSNEAELAGVLAHEIGHVVMKHHLKVLEKSKLINIASGLVSSQVASRNALSNAVAQNVLGNGAEALARGLDKDAEFEADRLGVVLATRAGYDPYGLPTVLDKLARVKPTDSSVALLFKTHPPPQERLVRLGDAMQNGFERFSQAKTVEARFINSTR